jgi:hypothetical protein
MHAQGVKVKFGAAANDMGGDRESSKVYTTLELFIEYLISPSSAKSHYILHTSKLYLLNQTTPTRDNKVIHEQDTKNNLSTRKLLGLITKETTTETEPDRYSVNWNNQIYINNGKTNR